MTGLFYITCYGFYIFTSQVMVFVKIIMTFFCCIDETDKYFYVLFSHDIYLVTKRRNDLQPPKTTYNHLKPPTTIYNHLEKFNNHLQPPQKHLQPPTNNRIPS